MPNYTAMSVTSVETVVIEILPLNFETCVALVPSATNEENQKNRAYFKPLLLYDRTAAGFA
jgi:hypothetical protein